MKNLISVAPFGVALVFVLGGFSGQSTGDESGQSVLRRGEVHEGWYFASGETVLIEGTVNGDVYAAGGQVEITGTVNGDVLAAGETVEISGAVSEDVRAAGRTVRISGTVEGNCTLAGASVIIAADGEVKDNVLAFGGEIRVSGRVEKEIRVGCEELVVSGFVGRDLHFGGEKVQILEGATVGGNATIHISVKNSATIAQGAVLGRVDTIVGKEREGEGLFGAGTGTWLFSLLYGLSLIMMAALVVFIVPKRTLEARTHLRRDLGMTLLWGFLGLIGVPLVAIVLLVVVIGIPLALFVMILYLWFLYLSQLSLPLLASSWISREETARGWRLFWPIAVGIIALQLVMLIPYAGMVLWLAGAILGVGAILRIVAPSMVTASKA